jgi:integrase
MATIKRRSDRGGRWEVRYRDPDGRQRARLFDRKVDAERFAATTAADIARGAWIDPAAGRVTFGDYAGRWLAARVHRPSTAARLESQFRVHVLPRLGDRPIGAVRHSEVQALVRALSETLAPGTVDNIAAAVSGVFRAAVRDRAVAANPCEGVTLPRRPRPEVVPPSVEEVMALLDAMPERYRVAGWLAAGAGLRQGEALGLTRDRVDFLRRQLRVDRQLVTPATGSPALAPPKSEASYRTVALADVVLDALSAHLAAFPAGPGGLFVTYDDGRPVRRNRFGAMWRQSVARAGLPTAFRYHDLRHHFASALIAGGCSVKVVQKALGHASARETLDTYSHLWPDSDDLTRRAVDAALGSRCAPDVHQAGAGEA